MHRLAFVIRRQLSVVVRHRLSVVIGFVSVSLLACSPAATQATKAEPAAKAAKVEPAKSAPVPEAAAVAASPCANGGKLQVQGAVKGQDLSILKTAWFFEHKGMTMVGLMEPGPSCAQRESVTIALGICGRAAKGYPVVDGPLDCKGNPAAALVNIERRDGIDLSGGTGGQIPVEHSSVECVAGRFEIKAGAATVKGTFAAPRCAAIKPLTKAGK